MPAFALKAKNSWARAAARSHQSFTDGSGELHRLKIVASILARQPPRFAPLSSAG
jgi:hypothetical protein